MRNLKMLTLALVLTSASVAAIGPALAKPADVGAAVAATANRSAMRFAAFTSWAWRWPYRNVKA